MPPKSKAEKKKPKRIDYKIDKEEWVLPCEWAKCHEVFNDMDTFIQHMDGHLHTTHGLYECSHEDKDEDAFVCQWRECGTRVVGEETDFFRHVYFHCFHVKIKCIGGLLIDKGKMQHCLLDTASRNLIPELPERLQCGWKNCEVVIDNPELFYRHVDDHAHNCPEGKKIQGGCMCEWEGCDLLCKNRYRMKEHLRSHTQEKTIACPTCGGLFASRTKFIDHLKRQEETDLQVYQCSHCNKRYATVRLLRDHVRHHVNQYKCPCCDMTCPTPSSLKSHLRYRHTNEKPYKCEHCDHCAKTLADLRKHLESHNVEAPFRCHITNCNYTARSYFSLANHFKRQHQELDVQKYACHVCKGIFTRGSKLTLHLKRRHKFRWPSGHSRFRYKLHDDGFWRLQTVRYESIQLTQQMEDGEETGENSNNASEHSNHDHMNDSEMDYSHDAMETDGTTKLPENEEASLPLCTHTDVEANQSVNVAMSHDYQSSYPVQSLVSQSSTISPPFQYSNSCHASPLSETGCVINIPVDERSLDKQNVVNICYSDNGQENKVNAAYNLEMLGDVALLIPNHPSDSASVSSDSSPRKMLTRSLKNNTSPTGHYVTLNAADL